MIHGGQQFTLNTLGIGRRNKQVNALICLTCCIAGSQYQVISGGAISNKFIAAVQLVVFALSGKGGIHRSHIPTATTGRGCRTGKGQGCCFPVTEFRQILLLLLGAAGHQQCVNAQAH